MSSEQRRREAIDDAFDRAFAGAKLSRRHPAEVTAGRVGDAVTRYRDRLTGAEADAFSLVVQVLEEVAEGAR